MFNESIYALIRKLILNSPISTVFEATLVKDANGITTPQYFDGTDFRFCGLDDTTGVTAYIRQNGDARYIAQGASSGNYMYMVEQGFRLVVCGKGAKYDNKKALFNVLLLFSDSRFQITGNTTDANRLFSQEQQGVKPHLILPTDLYFAIDFNAIKAFDTTPCKKVLDCYNLKSSWSNCDFEGGKTRNFSNDFTLSYS
jgi:hypothetical protein